MVSVWNIPRTSCCFRKPFTGSSSWAEGFPRSWRYEKGTRTDWLISKMSHKNCHLSTFLYFPPISVKKKEERRRRQRNHDLFFFIAHENIWKRLSTERTYFLDFAVFAEWIAITYVTQINAAEIIHRKTYIYGRTWWSFSGPS